MLATRWSTPGTRSGFWHRRNHALQEAVSAAGGEMVLDAEGGVDLDRLDRAMTALGWLPALYHALPGDQDLVRCRYVPRKAAGVADGQGPTRADAAREAALVALTRPMPLRA